MVPTRDSQTPPQPVFWRFRDVQAYLNWSRATVYKRIREDKAFPKPFHITKKLLGWYRTEIEEYAKNLRDRQRGD